MPTAALLSPDDPGQDASRAPSLEARIDAEISRRLHAQNIAGVVTNYGGLALVAWLHWTGPLRASLYAWAALWLSTSTLQLALHFLQLRAGGGKPAIGPKWRRLHLVVVNVLSVLPAGLMPWFLSDTPATLYLNTTIVMIYCAGVYSSMAMLSAPSYALSSAVILFPLAVLHAVQGTRSSYAIAGTLVFGFVMLLPFAVVHARTLRQAVRAMYENEDLATQLAQQKDRAEASRTAAEAAREAAEEANRTKARFLAEVTHDLRQPLHALSLTLETLASVGPSPDRTEAVDRARACSRQLSGMFDALLDQAQLDAGTRTLSDDVIPLVALFAQIEAHFQPVAQARGLWLRCRPTAAMVRADRLALWRIASNLVTNAIEATEHGGVLVAWRARRHALEVRDSGCGITPVHQAWVFQEFYRLPRPGDGRGRGLGLGLATVRRLASLMGGSVTLRSAPGRGSVFAVALPSSSVIAQQIELADPDRESASCPEPDIDVRGTRVLALDDDLAIRDALRDLLTQWSCDIRLAATIAQAEERLQDDWTPDVLLLDRRLPDGDGLALSLGWRDRWRPPPTCVIVTGDTAQEDLHVMARAGIAVLHKPVDPARLREVLASSARGRSRPPSTKSRDQF